MIRICLLLAIFGFGLLPATVNAAWKHAIAMHGEPLYGADFKQFAYVNPDAPKGGSLRISVVRSFDSTNPLIVKGLPAAGVRQWTLESLLARGHDEAFALYGLLAEAVDMPEDRSWITFRLNPEALKEPSDWVNRYRKFWEGQLDSLDAYLTRKKKGKSNGKRR